MPSGELLLRYIPIVGHGAGAKSASGFTKGAKGRQRSHDFGRIHAAYGGVFVVTSLLWGWGVDGSRPDRWDWAGAAVVLAGVGIIYLAPQS